MAIRRVLMLCLIFSEPALADKDAFTFVNPTPREQMRDLNPDRPGSTNTPNTVDAGHYQLELEMFSYSELTTTSMDPGTNNPTTTKVSQLNYPNFNLRTGVTNSIEVDVAYVARLSRKVTINGGGEQTADGSGDVNLRMKINRLGNEDGIVAWALMPGIKVPTDTTGAGNQTWEPTLMIPFAINFDGWNVSFMPEIDVRQNSDNNSLHSEFNSPFTLGHNLWGSVDGTAEIVHHTTNEDGGDSTSYVGVGLSWRYDKDGQVDIGCNFGANAATPKTNPFAGLTLRY